jgi:hypothetical protein
MIEQTAGIVLEHDQTIPAATAQRAAGGRRGPNAVNESAQKARLTLAAFDRPETLWLATAGLVENGVMPQQVGIAMCSRSLAGLAEPPRLDEADQRRVAPVIRRFDQMPVSGAIPGMLASSGLLSQLHDPAGAWTARNGLPDAKGPTHETVARLGDDIAAQVRQGATVLAVRSASAGEQWLSTRILLQHSSHPVATYELSLPVPVPAGGAAIAGDTTGRPAADRSTGRAS